jgi:hypothetical protein
MKAAWCGWDRLGWETLTSFFVGKIDGQMAVGMWLLAKTLAPSEPQNSW